MKKIEKVQVCIETLQKDVEIPDVVNDKLADIYEKIRADEVHMKGKKRKKKLYKYAWIAAAAACIVFVFGSVLYVNPALANDIPILGDVFGRLQQMREERPYPQKDKTAYENIEQHSKPVKAEPEKGLINTAEDQGITISVTDAYCDGLNLYFTLSLRTEDAELNTADRIDWLSYREGDPIAFWSWATVNGEEIYGSTLFSVNKAEDGAYVALCRIQSLDMKEGIFPEDMTVELDADAMGAHKNDESDIQHIPNYQRTGFKTVEGSWLLRFKPTMDMSNNKTAELHAENNGVIVQKVIQTPSNMHMTVYLPAEYAVKNPALVLTDINGNRVYIETSQHINQENGDMIQRIVLDYSDSSQFVLQVFDKNAEIEEGAGPPLLAEIPFSME